MPTVTKVTINPAGISRLFQPGGDVYRFTRGVGKEIETLATLTAPMGLTGSIKRSHRVFVTPSGMYGCFATVRNDSLHAAFVHKGTAGNGAGFIRPKHAQRLGPFISLQGGIIFPSKVRGQRANPWLSRAANTVMSKHGVPTTFA